MNWIKHLLATLAYYIDYAPNGDIIAVRLVAFALAVILYLIHTVLCYV